MGSPHPLSYMMFYAFAQYFYFSKTFRYAYDMPAGLA